MASSALPGESCLIASFIQQGVPRSRIAEVDRERHAAGVQLNIIAFLAATEGAGMRCSLPLFSLWEVKKSRFNTFGQPDAIGGKAKDSTGSPHFA